MIAKFFSVKQKLWFGFETFLRAPPPPPNSWFTTQKQFPVLDRAWYELGGSTDTGTMPVGASARRASGWGGCKPSLRLCPPCQRAQLSWGWAWARLLVWRGLRCHPKRERRALLFCKSGVASQALGLHFQRSHVWYFHPYLPFHQLFAKKGWTLTPLPTWCSRMNFSRCIIYTIFQPGIKGRGYWSHPSPHPHNPKISAF